MAAISLADAQPRRRRWSPAFGGPDFPSTLPDRWEDLPERLRRVVAWMADISLERVARAASVGIDPCPPEPIVLAPAQVPHRGGAVHAFDALEAPPSHHPKIVVASTVEAALRIGLLRDVDVGGRRCFALSPAAAALYLRHLGAEAAERHGGAEVMCAEGRTEADADPTGLRP